MRQVLIWTLMLGLVGCAGMGYRAEDLKVNIASLKLLDSSLMEQRYQVGLRVQNRSKNRLEIRGLSFDVELNGKDFASGVSNQQVSVPAFDEALLQLEVSSTLFGLIRQIRSMQELRKEAFDYQISGRVHAGSGFLSIPFEETGEIDLRVPDSQPERI